MNSGPTFTFCENKSYNKEKSIESHTDSRKLRKLNDYIIWKDSLYQKQKEFREPIKSKRSSGSLS